MQFRDRLSLAGAARHPTLVANGSERSVILDAAAEFLRGAGRVTTAFTCVFVTYLVSGIPSGVAADVDAVVHAPAVIPSGSAQGSSRGIATVVIPSGAPAKRPRSRGIAPLPVEGPGLTRTVADSTRRTGRRTASRVAADSFWSQALGIRKQFVVYFPPSYETSPARRYPVAYYLHGLSGDEWNWVRAGRIDRTLDSLIADGTPEMIV